MKQLKSLLFIASIGIIAIVAFSLTNRQESSLVFEKGMPAPNILLTDFDGNSKMLSTYQGKPVVLDVWASWCAFCIEEMAILEKMQKEFGDGVVILGVHRTDSGETLDQAREFADSRGVTYTLVQDTKGDVYKSLSRGYQVMPVAAFIDRDGIVQEVKLGAKTEDEIRSNIERLVN